jgi:cell division septation protein DedD
MNKNLLRGLAVGAALIILLMVLYRLYIERPPQTGPSPVTAPSPVPAVPPALTPPGAAPAPKESGQKELPAAPAKEAAPSPELSPPAPKVTVFPPEKEKEHYGMLVGRYRKYRDAGKMLARLKKQGIPGFIRRDAGKPLPYQVWAGPFSSREEAMEAAKSLQAMLKRTPEIQKLQIPIPK